MINLYALILLCGILFILLQRYYINPSINPAKLLKLRLTVKKVTKNRIAKHFVLVFIVNGGILWIILFNTGYRLSDNLIYQQKGELTILTNGQRTRSIIEIKVKISDRMSFKGRFPLIFSVTNPEQSLRNQNFIFGKTVIFSGITSQTRTINYYYIRLTYITSMEDHSKNQLVIAISFLLMLTMILFYSTKLVYYSHLH